MYDFNQNPTALWNSLIKQGLSPSITTIEEYNTRIVEGTIRARQYLAAEKAVYGLTSSQIKKAHEHLFTGIYDWAGKFRKIGVEVAVGQHRGADSRAISYEIELARRQYGKMLDKAAQPNRLSSEILLMGALAFYHARLILIQPFLDRNKVFMRTILAQQFSELTGGNAELTFKDIRAYGQTLDAAVAGDLAPLTRYLIAKADHRVGNFTLRTPFRMAPLPVTRLHPSITQALNTTMFRATPT